MLHVVAKNVCDFRAWAETTREWELIRGYKEGNIRAIISVQRTHTKTIEVIMQSKRVKYYVVDCDVYDIFVFKCFFHKQIIAITEKK